MTNINQSQSDSKIFNLSFTKITNSIQVQVRPKPVFEETDLTNKIFCFQYDITITNLGEETVQLLERHWIITSAGKLFDEVVGDGVVGMQPHIEAGKSFDYSSGAVIADPYGSMKGSYTMRASSGKYFEIEIPEFELIHLDYTH